MASLVHALPSRARAQGGLTLIELIISAGLLGLLAVSASWFWVKNFTLVRTVNDDSNAIADGRAVLERLAREIREVKTTGAAYCIQSLASPTQLVFLKNAGTVVSATCNASYANPDNSTNDMAVSIALTGTTLNLGYAGANAAPATTAALTTQASAFRMDYFDANYVATTSASAVRFVQLSLTTLAANTPATQTRLVVGLRNE